MCIAFYGENGTSVLRVAQRVSFTVCSIYKLLLRYYSYRKRTEALAGSCAEIWAENSIMAGNRCVLCGSTRATDPGASFHRFPG